MHVLTVIFGGAGKLEDLFISILLAPAGGSDAAGAGFLVHLAQHALSRQNNFLQQLGPLGAGGFFGIILLFLLQQFNFDKKLSPRKKGNQCYVGSYQENSVEREMGDFDITR